MDLTNILIEPLHTEKSYLLRKGFEKSTLVFIVNKKANKNDVRRAFLKIYGVNPEKINTQIKKPQNTKVGTAHPGKTKKTKIAFIILPKGIDIALTQDEIAETQKK